MSYIQAKDDKELNTLTEKKGFCFTTEDNRIHGEVIVWNESGGRTLDAETVSAILEIHDSLEWMTDDGSEWGLIQECAERFDGHVKRARELLKYKPIKRKVK